MLPEIDLNGQQQKFLELLLSKFDKSGLSPERIHQEVYDAALSAELKPAEAFRTIYNLFLNKDHGPKVGFFLASLEKQRNTLAAEVTTKPTDMQVALGKDLKSQYESIATDLKSVELKYEELLSQVPNLIAEGTPDGGEENNLEIESWGDKKQGGKDHLELNELHNLYDFEAGSKVAGNKFYFTRHKGVKLWQSIQLVVQEIIEQSGFELLAVPHLVNTEIAAGTGYLPKGEEQQNYIDSEQGLVMIATSEIPLTGFHKDEVLDLGTPKKYAAQSPCYRLEAGAYGKHSKGLYRVHQFDKLEMYIFCQSDQSDQLLQEILAIEKRICQSLEIPYRVVRIAAVMAKNNLLTH